MIDGDPTNDPPGYPVTGDLDGDGGAAAAGPRTASGRGSFGLSSPLPMRTRCLLAAFLIWTAAACARPVEPRPAAPQPLACDSELIVFENVGVIPMDHERVLADHTVAVCGDRIIAVEPSGERRPPPGARIIDGRGRFLVPGLHDMHVHTADEALLTLYVVNGITTVRDLSHPFDQKAAWRAEIASSRRLGPTMFISGPIIDGDPPHWRDSAVAVTAEEARRIVAEQKQQGVDVLKVYTRLSPEAYDAIIEAAREEGLPVVGHVPSAVGLERVLAAGQRSIEHLDGYPDFLERADSPLRDLDGFLIRMLRVPAYMDESRLEEIATRTAAAGTWNCPTLVLHRDAYQSPDRIAELRERPEMRYVPAPLVEIWQRPMPIWKRLDEAALADRSAAFEAQKRLIAALYAAGARLLVGTDAPNPDVIPGFAVHEELALFVEAGLTPFQALRAATRDGAEFLGVLDQVGTIEVGKRADLLLLDANPLADITATRRIAGVLLRGAWHGADDLQRRLDALARP